MTDQPGADPGQQPAGCGVQGCLAAAVALFVILLVAMLYIAVIRFSSPPQPRFGAADSHATPIEVASPSPGRISAWPDV